MKFLVRLIFICLSGGTIAVGAQNTAQDECRTLSFQFQCPSDAKVLISGKKGGLFGAINQKTQIVIFAQEIADKKSGYELGIFHEILKKILKKAFSVRESDVTFRMFKDDLPGHKYNLLEEYERSYVAFNKKDKELLQIRYAVIGFQNKRLLGGFVRSLKKGSEAEAEFDGWKGIGLVNADSELVEFFTSITKK